MEEIIDKLVKIQNALSDVKKMLPNNESYLAMAPFIMSGYDFTIELKNCLILDSEIIINIANIFQKK